jgi:hypothetical protein
MSRTSKLRCPAGALAALTLLLAPTPSLAQSTTWVGGLNLDWSLAGNWTNGRPTSGVDAVVIAGVPDIASGAEECRSLTVGGSPNGASVSVNGGTLLVAQQIQAGVSGTGSLLVLSGGLTAGELFVGSPTSTGAFIMSGGTVDVGNVAARSPGSPGSGMILGAMANRFTATGNFHVDPSCAFHVNSGDITIGDSPADVFTLNGFLTMNGARSMAISNLTMTASASITTSFSAETITPIIVAGTATVDGFLFIQDQFAVPPGTYEVLRGAPLAGEFDFVSLPTPDWSWHIANNSLFVTKVGVAVEPVTWSGIKAGPRS